MPAQWTFEACFSSLLPYLGAQTVHPVGTAQDTVDRVCVQSMVVNDDGTTCWCLNREGREFVDLCNMEDKSEVTCWFRQSCVGCCAPQIKLGFVLLRLCSPGISSTDIDANE